MNRQPTSRERGSTARASFGAVLLKPDAIAAGQEEIIKSILIPRLASFGGRIVTERVLPTLSATEVAAIYPTLQPKVLTDVADYLASGPSLGLIVEAPLPEPTLTNRIIEIKGPRVGDRTLPRLLEGRITNGTLRDLLPLPGDEERYQDLIPAILLRQANPAQRLADPLYGFSPEQYHYYSRNLVHSPDDAAELQGLLSVLGVTAMEHAE